MAFIDQIEKAQGQALNTLTEGQQRALEVNGRMADVLKGRVPQAKFPFAGVLPTPSEGIKLYFDFAGKVMAKNRKFAEQFVDAWDIAPAKATVASKATAAPKAAAKKAPAKKAPAKKAAAKKTTAKV
jgi:hypothetical protein